MRRTHAVAFAAFAGGKREECKFTALAESYGVATD